MLGTLLNGSLGLLGLWADCKVGKSNSVVFLLSLCVLKKSVCMQSLHSQHPHKSVHAALLVMYKNHIQALFILWLMQFSSKSLNTDSLAVLGTLHTCSTSATTLSCAQIPLLLCVTAKKCCHVSARTRPREIPAHLSYLANKAIRILMCPPNSAL